MQFSRVACSQTIRVDEGEIMQVSSVTAIGVTLLIAGASGLAARSGNAELYLQTIVSTADWIIQDAPVDSRDHNLSAEASSKSTGAVTMTESEAPAWMHYLNVVGLALAGG